MTPGDDRAIGRETQPGVTSVPQFTDLGPIGAQFQGGFIVLQGHGCPGCGNGFWTEAVSARRLATGTVHHCPHCGERREVTA